ncbi:MAG: peptide ABC transporter permease [Chloroflexi bacterium]|nr:peptide ABC transporter permease [Chloroflexota bacterium]|tara:strand:- start:2795 stop:3718 length:924 start_codon:yes stop_codon:yes gene_type:complete
MNSNINVTNSPALVEVSLRSKIFYVLRRWPVIPILILTIMVFIAVFAPIISPMGPKEINLRGRAAPPIWEKEWYDANPKNEKTYLLGADHVGRDVLTRMFYGARISLAVAVISLTAGVVIGSAIGLVSGYYGGFIDEFSMRAVDVWNALPFLLIAILAAVTFGQEVWIVMVLLALVAWAGNVRNVRAEVLTLKTRDYVALAKIAGASDFRILMRHIFPGVVNTIVVLATLRVGGLILAEASLSFLGAGIPAQTPTWGNMISEGREWLSTAWWIAMFPGIAILLVVMSVNFFGDWLRDRWDPRLRQLS